MASRPVTVAKPGIINFASAVKMFATPGASRLATASLRALRWAASAVRLSLFSGGGGCVAQVLPLVAKRSEQERMSQHHGCVRVRKSASVFSDWIGFIMSAIE